MLCAHDEEAVETKEYNRTELNELTDQLGQCVENCKAVEGIYLAKEILKYPLPEGQCRLFEQVIALLEEIEYEDAEKLLQGVVYERQNEDSGH